MLAHHASGPDWSQIATLLLTLVAAAGTVAGAIAAWLATRAAKESADSARVAAEATQRQAELAVAQTDVRLSALGRFSDEFEGVPFKLYGYWVYVEGAAVFLGRSHFEGVVVRHSAGLAKLLGSDFSYDTDFEPDNPSDRRLLKGESHYYALPVPFDLPDGYAGPPGAMPDVLGLAVTVEYRLDARDRWDTKWLDPEADERRRLAEGQ